MKVWHGWMIIPNRRLSLQWRHNDHDDFLNHQPYDCLLNRLFRRRSKITSKLRITDLCAGNSQVTGEFPAQRASNAENVSIWWRHHGEVITHRHHHLIHYRLEYGIFEKHNEDTRIQLTFWLAGNGLVPTTNKWCDLNATPKCSVMDEKYNLKYPKLKIHIWIYRNVSFLKITKFFYNFQGIHHYASNLWQLCVYLIIRYWHHAKFATGRITICVRKQNSNKSVTQCEISCHSVF